ncbi:MAG: dihydropteroate synthase [Limnohabitans sp.]
MSLADNDNMGHLPHFRFWKTTRFELSLERPLVMGIVNVTPDSFSSPNDSVSVSKAIANANDLLREGADILDVGGESTRPGATALTHEQEWQRVSPVLDELLRWGKPISLDTYHPQSMQKALDKGVDIINDVWALRQPNSMKTVAPYQCGVCLMHMHAEPSTMQIHPMEEEVMDGLLTFFQTQLSKAQAHRIDKNRVVLDPGIGFGKKVSQNFHILKAQRLLLKFGYPLMVGWSRKSSLGHVTGLEVSQRLVPSIAAALIALERGASVLRVHDVAHTVAARAVWQASVN